MKTFFVYFVFMAAAMLSMISCVRRTDEAEKEPDNTLVGGLTLDADSLRMELTDTLRVAVGGTGGFTVGVADEAVAEARAEGRTIVVAAVGCGFTSVRVVSEGSRRHEIVLPVRVVERRTPWAFDDALADASVRFEGVGKAIRYDEGGVIAERTENSADGTVAYRLVDLSDDHRVNFRCPAEYASLPCLLDGAELSVDGVPHRLSVAMLEWRADGRCWFNLISSATGRRIVLVVAD